MNGPVFSFVQPQKAEKPYTVSEINQGVGSIIEAGNTLVWVEGELSNFKKASSGHCYLKLKDAQSQIPAVIWKNVASELSFEPQDGMQIIAIASVRVYTRGGYYQLDLHKIQPAGVGALFAAFEKLKRKLEAQGLFDPARKKPLPPRIGRLGVITSKNGAALHDIVKVTRSRSRRIDIIVIDVPVQGEKAAPAIVQAIRDMNTFGAADCIIVGRGGGSIEDLWAFNEESVALAIAQSTIPIISAVGHEIDFTIADFVADVRAPTPSAAAEMAIADDEQNRRYFIARAQYIARRFISYFSTVRSSYQRLLQRPGLRRAMRITVEARQTADDLQQRRRRAMENILRHLRDRHGRAASHLHALSPLNTLARGFSVVAKTDGTVLKNVANVAAGERIAIRFFKGEAQADVVKRTE
jgi:exodeoxyribonuclease VII large subunit